MGGAPAGRLRIGTRGSALALTQAEAVIDRLAAIVPGLAIEPVVIRTEGDVDKTSPLTLIGGRGVFTSALQEALRRGEIDAAVHSAKDLPSGEPADLVLAAFPEREDPRDVLVSRHGCPLTQLPPAPVVGTSSRRRAIQVWARRPDARIVELRGNVDTRLRKALATEVDAIVLAAAGVRRMGWQDRITEVLPLDAFVPSPGQGALAVEARHGDEEILALLAAIDDLAVSHAVRVERAFLRAIGGGCTTPVGANVERDGERLRLRAMLASEDGERVEWADERLDPGEAEAAAAEVAVGMLARVRAAGGKTFGYRSAPGLGAGSTSGRPLAGLTVLVTRARAQAVALADALRREGAEPLELPTIRVEDPIDPVPLDAALARLRDGAYDWVVFTSANGVEKTLASLERAGTDTSALAGARVVAVGPATGEALVAAGVGVDLVPERFAAEAVVAALAAEGIAGRRVLYPRADIARDALPEGLRAAGAIVDAIDAYRTIQETAVDPAALARLRRGEVDIATFASGSSVRNLVALLGGDMDGLGRATIACVGASTAAAARGVGLDVAIVAEDSTIPGLVAALVRHQTEHVSGNGATDGREPVRVFETEMVGARGGGSA